jgi:hypothetical protein
MSPKEGKFWKKDNVLKIQSEFEPVRPPRDGSIH